MAGECTATAVKLITWNVNSVRARLERLLALLDRHRPDVVCLQELKCTDEAFPTLEIRGAGYYTASFGQKTYNGVAILSRTEAKDIVRGFGDNVDDSEARLIAATIGNVRVLSAYFPNGAQIGSESYGRKLVWMKRLRGYLDGKHKPFNSLVLAGDFNVAPDDLDVANPDPWRNTVLCADDVRAALAHIGEFGLVDVFRRFHPEGHVYSWWDYRMLGFPKNDGLRIDHIFATASLAARARAAEVDRNERKGKLPSDHAPVIATFD